MKRQIRKTGFMFMAEAVRSVVSFSGEINKAGYLIESTAQVYLSVLKLALYSGDYEERRDV